MTNGKSSEVLDGDKDVTVGELLRGKPFKMTVCATRMELDSIPTDESDCKKYLFNLFEEKVKLIFNLFKRFIQG